MKSKTFFIETYGCQMNFSDSEIVNSIMLEKGLIPSETAEKADVILVNTCAIRDNAEKRVWKRLEFLRSIKRTQNHDMIVGLLGCMAERLKESVLEKEKLVDLVVGPDAYRSIPDLLEEVEDGRKAVNVILSLEETYADIAPVRTTGNGVLAFVSIMRGCDNMCAFCVVPFTRGRERSRDVESILSEVQTLSDNGYKEITLLGQNVNSYNDNGTTFTELIILVSEINPEIRVRFSSPHPKDFPDELLYAIAERPNLCNYIHIPAQSGSNTVLERMKRPYTREYYISLIEKMRSIIPGLALSTDIISGFCGETDKEHADTVNLMATVQYDLAYMYAYSERERTLAQRKYVDDVPEDVKIKRLMEVVETQHAGAKESNEADIGKRHLVLVEGPSKRNQNQYQGRTDTNKMVIFDRNGFDKGEFVEVEITGATSATLFGNAIKKSSISEFSSQYIVA